MLSENTHCALNQTNDGIVEHNEIYMPLLVFAAIAAQLSERWKLIAEARETPPSATAKNRRPS